MPKKQIILTFFSLVSITAFFLLPENRSWAIRLIGYGKEFNNQRRALDDTTRFRKRFGNDYTYTMTIAGMMQKGGRRNALLLMPPTTYFTKAGVKYHVPEPAVFYYLSGIKTIWADSKDAISADYFVFLKNGKILLAEGRNKAALEDTIAEFRKLGYSL